MSERVKDILNSINDTVSQKSQAENDFTRVEEIEKESPEMELMEYKYDFYQMSLGAIKSIAVHAQAILDAVESESVKEGLTESWLQGKIAVTEDYMLTIHNFLMHGETETDTEGAEAAKNLPGLWENIHISQQNQEIKIDQIPLLGKRRNNLKQDINTKIQKRANYIHLINGGLIKKTTPF